MFFLLVFGSCYLIYTKPKLIFKQLLWKNNIRYITCVLNLLLHQLLIINWWHFTRNMPRPVVVIGLQECQAPWMQLKPQRTS